MINSSCAISDRPGRSGLCPNNSPKMHPTAHISTDVVCTEACNSSSGALYHSVTTCGVMGLVGKPNHRASPKSARN